jgi:transcriptional regulator
MSEKKLITVSQILDLLNEGKTRKEIKEELNLTENEIKFVFKHPKLKGKKAKKPLSIELVDDTTNNSIKNSNVLYLTEEDSEENSEENLEENPVENPTEI